MLLGHRATCEGPSVGERCPHLAVVLLAEAHPVLEKGQQGEVVLQRLGNGDRHHRLAGVGVDPAGGKALPQALDEVVFGQPHTLVCAHAVVTEVLLAVQALGGGWVLLIAGAALRFSQVVEEAPVGMVEGRGTSHQPPTVVVAVLVLDLIF